MSGPAQVSLWFGEGVHQDTLRSHARRAGAAGVILTSYDCSGTSGRSAPTPLAEQL
jgi:hypothetical protein